MANFTNVTIRRESGTPAYPEGDWEDEELRLRHVPVPVLRPSPDQVKTTLRLLAMLMLLDSMQKSQVVNQ